MNQPTTINPVQVLIVLMAPKPLLVVLVLVVLLVVMSDAGACGQVRWSSQTDGQGYFRGQFRVTGQVG